jgi:hypothetical protein
MTARLMSFILMLALVVSFGAPMLQDSAKAQEGWCTLSEEDCAIVNSAVETSGTVTSVNLDSMTLVFQFSAGESANVDMSLEGSGPIVMVEDGVSPFDADLTFSGTSTSNGEEEAIEGARVVIQGDKVYSFNPEDSTWSVEEADAESMSGLDLNSITPEAIMGGLTALPEGTVVWARQGDLDMNGTPVAVFTADVMLGDLFGNAEFQAQLAEQLGALLEEQGLDASTISMGMGMVLPSLLDQFNTATFRYTIAIDPATSLVHGISFDMVMDLDLSSLAAMMGQDASAIPPVAMLIDLDIAFSGHNGEFEIVVPEEAMAAEGATEGATEGE